MIATATSFLDAASESLERGHVHLGIERLFVGLHGLRNELPADDWRAFVTETIPEHPIYALVQRCPMVRHAFDKPRGYPGDAELLDYLYRLRRPVDDGSLGARIWDHTTLDRPAALAVRKRRDVLAAYLDALAERPSGARRALSVACGHLREGLVSDAVGADELDRLVALDSDARSLDVVRDCFGATTVEPTHLSVRDLIRGDAIDGPFDLVYSAGLYDYLDTKFATRLTARLFDLTAPGGTLLLCNFVPDLYDIGYMEIFMGWELIYRTPDELRALTGEIDAADIASTRVWTDTHHAVAYLEIVRADR